MLQCTRVIAVAFLLALASDNARSEETPTLKQLLKQERDESDRRPSSPWGAVRVFLTYHEGPELKYQYKEGDGRWREYVDTRIFVMSWFRGEGETVLRYTVSNTGRAHDVRHIHNWALQASHDKQLDQDEMNRLNALVVRLPKSTTEPPIDRTVCVSFKDKDGWRTETYDSERLPSELESVLQILGERFETRDRHKSKTK